MIGFKSVSKHILTLLGLVIVISGSARPAGAQDSKLGSVDFPTSGSPQAQTYFLRGLAALHSFWFEEAFDNFKQAADIDPDFMMAYWGEAMSYNHPLWAQQDAESARKIIAKIHDTPKLTAREREYLDAVKALYGKGDKLERDFAYSKAMAKEYHDYPEDMEGACFYALSLLGTVRPGDKGFKRQMQAGAIALEVYRKNPNHPGAAHYIIHAFDDPDHAILALPAALRYAEIAPEASHARHMPAHIFVQLGMWPEAAASNESAWAVSDAWVKRKNLSITLRDYHSFHWLTYVYLQQGRDAKAAELIAMLRATVENLGSEGATWPMQQSLENMMAEYVVGAQSWDKAKDFFPLAAKPGASSQMDKASEHTGAHAMGGQSYQGGDQAMSLFVRGLADAELGNAAARTSAEKLHAMAETLKTGMAYRAKLVEIMALEVDAVSKAGSGKTDAAIEMMKQAISIEDEMSPPSGPPDSIKPPRELFGEILLRANRFKEAVDQFDAALAREPNRARSLIGRARALTGAGNAAEAKEAYEKFSLIWKLADSNLPELNEARRYTEPSAGQ
jgi:tetratricopeptide (TPR) repeat protein